MKEKKDQCCRICEAPNFALLMPIKDYSISQEDFELHRCSNCGFVWTASPPSEAMIGAYYHSEDYISHSDIDTGLKNKLYHWARKMMLGRKYRLIASLHTDKAILDVGCGTGYFLNHMKNKGYATLGVEADQGARTYGAEKFQLQVLPPQELLNGAIKQKFGIISLWHVLEHLYSPQNYLQSIRDLLKDDGYLIVALPNLKCFDAQYYKAFWAGYDVPRHLWHFSPKTFTVFARKNGFKIIKMRRLMFDPFYNAILSEEHKSSKLSLVKGMAMGLISAVKGLFNIRCASSLVYVLKPIFSKETPEN